MGLADSTQKTYRAASKRFNDFCIKFNINTPFPVSERLLCSFAAYLADDGLKPGSIKVYLAAIRSLQINLGLPDPRDQSSLPRLKRIMAGIARCQLKKGSRTKPRLPITSTILGKIHRELSQDSQMANRTLIWAISSLAFFGFFRLGELIWENPTQYNPTTHLSWGDIAVNNRDNPTVLRVHLKCSKCDQFGQGVDVVVGNTGSAICPVKAVSEYISQRGDCEGPFFIDQHRQPVKKSWFIKQIRQILQRLGLPQEQYAGHSFRIGAATSAALAGVEDSTIQALGRWHSAAFLQYIRIPRQSLAHISQKLSTVAGRSCPAAQSPQE